MTRSKRRTSSHSARSWRRAKRSVGATRASLISALPCVVLLDPVAEEHAHGPGPRPLAERPDVDARVVAGRCPDRPAQAGDRPVGPLVEDRERVAREQVGEAQVAPGCPGCASGRGDRASASRPGGSPARRARGRRARACDVRRWRLVTCGSASQASRSGAATLSPLPRRAYAARPCRPSSPTSSHARSRRTSAPATSRAPRRCPSRARRRDHHTEGAGRHLRPRRGRGRVPHASTPTPRSSGSAPRASGASPGPCCRSRAAPARSSRASAPR